MFLMSWIWRSEVFEACTHIVGKITNKIRLIQKIWGIFWITFRKIRVIFWISREEAGVAVVDDGERENS